MGWGCVEFAVPGSKLEEKLKVLESRGMWLELINDGFGEERLKDILGILPSFDTSIKSIQAFLLHDIPMLNAKEGGRKVAQRHVEETIRIASAVGAQNVVTVATYGEPRVKNPREKCIRLFRHFGKLGAESNVIISIEALSRDKTTFLPSVSELHGLIDEIGSDRVRLLADTMHIHANGENVAEVVEEYVTKFAEVQLRDTDSKPLGEGDIDFETLLKILRDEFRGLKCLEYKPGPDPYADFDRACEFVKNYL